MKFKYKNGALTCNEPIENLTQELSVNSAGYYGNKYFICEAVTQVSARIIAGMILQSQIQPVNLPLNNQFEVE